MNLKKYKLLIFCLTGLFLCSPSVVFAGADSGFYIGVGVGDTTVKTKTLKESDSSGKIFGGYYFGIIPLIDIAVEAAYIGFGNTSTNIGGIENSYDISGTNAYGLVGLTFGPFGLFAKAGVINWSSDIVTNNVKTSDSGNDAAYGIGAKIQISALAVRVEYEVFDVSSVEDLNMASIGIAYTF